MTELLDKTALEPSALTIAGSDSGAGAGIQADLKTFAALGVFGCSVVTMVTAQNTQGVGGIELVSEQLLEQQLDAVFEDFNIAAAKTGALGSRATIELVCGKLAGDGSPKLVVDPVMISKHGHRLVVDSAVPVIREQLLPLAAVVTPNIPEAEVLAGMEAIRSREDMLEAAQRIAAAGCGCVVVKGGHTVGDPADLVWDGTDARWLETERIDTRHTHGTGCTFSAAITAGLAAGLQLHAAIDQAKSYITGAIANTRLVGRGINPVNHFWQGKSEV